jgi:ubiquitin-protein ligase
MMDSSDLRERERERGRDLLKRLQVEAAELSTDSDSAGVSAKPISEDKLRWKGTINGPKETPCDGCTFATD